MNQTCGDKLGLKIFVKRKHGRRDSRRSKEITKASCCRVTGCCFCVRVFNNNILFFVPHDLSVVHVHKVILRFSGFVVVQKVHVVVGGSLVSRTTWFFGFG